MLSIWARFELLGRVALQINEYVLVLPAGHHCQRVVYNQRGNRTADDPIYLNCCGGARGLKPGGDKKAGCQIGDCHGTFGVVLAASSGPRTFSL